MANIKKGIAVSWWICQSLLHSSGKHSDSSELMSVSLLGIILNLKVNLIDLNKILGYVLSLLELVINMNETDIITMGKNSLMGSANGLCTRIPILPPSVVIEN